MTKLGLLKSGKLMNRWMIERWHPLSTFKEEQCHSNNRIRHVVGIQIILSQGEWSSAKEAKTILKICNKRQRQTFFILENVNVFDITRICFYGKTYSENLRSIKNTGKDLTMKQMFDISEKLIVGQWDEIYWVNTINCMILHGNIFIFGQWWRSHQFLAREGLRIFRFCVMLWKDETEPNIKYCLGRKIEFVQELLHHNTELWT